MKKLFISVIPFSILLIPCLGAQAKKEDSSLLDRLRLDQKEAYISISATNEEGYDRWLSFYLSLPNDSESLSDKEMAEKLREEIDSLSL